MRSATEFLRAAGVEAGSLDSADRLLACALLQRLTPLQIASCVADPPFEAALVRRGLLAPGEVEEARRQAKGLRCLPCGEVYLDEGGSGRADCPDCGAVLARRSLLAETDDVGEPGITAAVAGRIRKYVVTEFVARGAMGAVYKALHPQLGRVIALKILNETLASPAFLERFRTEALAAARLSHPNIVRVLDAGTEGGLHYVAMELVEGGSLEELLDGDRDVRRLLAMLEKIARAMQHAHEQGVVHRDLKPSNVLVRTDGEPFVADFGIARLMDQEKGQTRTGARLGTPAYMAPEQVVGGTVGPRTDVYALGVLLYRILTGRLPHEGPSIESVYHAIATATVAAPRRHNPALHRDIEVICLKALEREPRHRYASAKDFADDLARFIAGAAIVAQPASLPARLWRRARRHPAAALAVILAAACVTSLGAWGAARRAWKSEQASALAMMRETAPSLVELALSLRRKGQLEAMRPIREMLAKTHLQASARAPELPEIDYWMGRMHRALMEDDEALRFQEKALAKDASFAPARYERAVLNSLRYRDGMRGAEGRWRARHPQGEPPLGELEDAALRALRESIVRDTQTLEPSDLVREAMVQAARGIAAQRLGGDGRQLLRGALRLDPLLEEAYEALAETGSLEEREQCYEEAVTRDRGYLRHWLGLGDVRIRRSEIDRSIEAFSQAIALDPACFDAWLGRGQAYIQGGSKYWMRGIDPRAAFEEAEKNYQEGARLRPDRVEPYVGLSQSSSGRALYCVAQGLDPFDDWSRAEGRLAEAMKRDERWGDVWYMRAVVRTNRALHRLVLGGDPGDDFNGAEADCTKALELNARDGDAWHARGKARLNRATQRLKSGGDPGADYDAAEGDLDRALGFMPASVEAWVGRGLVHLGRGVLRAQGKGDAASCWDLAIGHFTRAIELDGYHAEAYLRRGIARGYRAELTRDRAQLDEAVQDWEKAIQLNPRLEPQVRDRLKWAKGS